MNGPIDTTQRDTSRPAERQPHPDQRDPGEGWTMDLHPPRRLAPDSKR